MQNKRSTIENYLDVLSKKSIMLIITIIGLLSTLSLSSFASDITAKPEVFVNMGHTRKDPPDFVS